MPDNEADTTLVSHKIRYWLGQICHEAAFRYLPYLHGTVLRRAGNDIIIMWTPLNVEDSSLVTSDQRCVLFYSPSL
jgi:hypothetical protein